MSDELGGVDVFLAGVLRSHPGVAELVGEQVFAELADAGTDPPYVIVNYRTGSDHGTSGTEAPVYSWLEYTVRAVTQRGNFGPVGQIAGQIHQALSGAHGVALVDGSAYRIKAVHRRAPLRYGEAVDGVSYQHQGGIYRLMVSLAAEE